MYAWMMKDALQKEWNDDAVIVPFNQNKQFKSRGNKLKVIVPLSSPVLLRVPKGTAKLK